MPVTVPSSLLIVLEVLRPCFTAPSFTTMAVLVTGVLSGNSPRTVTGMWQAAGLAGKAHWSRAHRFFSRAVWDLDQVGLALARAVVARFVPRGAAVTLAVDDTLFHRYGKKDVRPLARLNELPHLVAHHFDGADRPSQHGFVEDRP